MPGTVYSQFVQSIASEFVGRYPMLAVAVRYDGDGELWIECNSDISSRFRSPLTFGITDDSITVAFDGLTKPILIRPPYKDAETARREAFGLFDDLIGERKVVISFWQGDECFGVEFISHEQIQSHCDGSDYAVRIRSWLGKYDCDVAALNL